MRNNFGEIDVPSHDSVGREIIQNLGMLLDPSIMLPQTIRMPRDELMKREQGDWLTKLADGDAEIETIPHGPDMMNSLPRTQKFFHPNTSW